MKKTEQQKKIDPSCTFIFWRYSEFPFVLGAQAEKFIERTDEERAKTPVPMSRYVGYVGSYQGYMPVRFATTPEKGRVIKEKLDELDREYHNAQRELSLAYKRKALEVAPFLKKLPEYKEVE